jgi:hypothetical protein
MPSGRIFPLAVLERAVKEFNDEHCAAGSALGTILAKDEVPHTVINISRITHFVDKLEIVEGRIIATLTVIHALRQPSPQAALAGTLASYCSDSSKAVIVGSGSTDEKTDIVFEDYSIHRVDLRVDLLSEGDIFPKQAHEPNSGWLPDLIANEFAKDFAEVQPMPENVSEAFKEACKMPEMSAGEFVNVQPTVKEHEGSTFKLKIVQLTDEIRAEYTMGGNILLSESQMEFVVIPALMMKNLCLPTEAMMFFNELLCENPGYALALYSTGPVTWMTMCGRAGIAVIEESTTRVVAAHTTCMS